jgi:site-specific DNA-methyltransferase (adenine-specific)
MATVPDKYFDLAVVAPPTGKDMPAPTKEYFKELLRVSWNQIVWGASHYTNILPYPSRCWIVWNKLSIDPHYNDCVLAWTSFDTVLKKANIEYSGFRGSDGDKIHPTQKPVKLYDWIFKNFAKEGDKILDTHLGSGSSRIAANKAGLDFVGCELDKEYFDAAEKRYQQFISQVRLHL